MTEQKTEPTDQQLVVRVQKGDKRAFDLLVLKYQYKVHAIVARFIRDSDEVRDVVQEAFIKAYRALPKFRGDSQFYTWLYRIAVNTAKNYLVARSRRPPSSDVDLDDAEDLRTAVTLREYEGLSYEDIAAVMDCPVGTIRSRIFRGREAIDARVVELVEGR